MIVFEWIMANWIWITAVSLGLYTAVNVLEYFLTAKSKKPVAGKENEDEQV